jgi:hypothetical protein
MYNSKLSYSRSSAWAVAQPPHSQASRNLAVTHTHTHTRQDTRTPHTPARGRKRIRLWGLKRSRNESIRLAYNGGYYEVVAPSPTSIRGGGGASASQSAAWSDRRPLGRMRGYSVSVTVSMGLSTTPPVEALCSSRLHATTSSIYTKYISTFNDYVITK